MEDLYDGGVRQCDAFVGRLLDGLCERQALDETLVVVTADHGEGFGETSHLDGRPVVEHKQGAHPVQTYVPLVVRAPDRGHARVSEPVCLTETATVLRDAADGAFSAESFIREGPVRISYADATAQQVEDSDAGEQTRSVVQRTDGAVRKDSARRDAAAAVRVADAQTEAPLDAPASAVRAAVERAFEGVADRGPSAGRRGEVDDATMDRLERLGYR
jgi:arylsulfatase A-like enzyme